MRISSKHFLFEKVQLLQFKSQFAVLPKCRSCPYFSAALFRSYHRKIISHSDGHSVVKYKRLKIIPSRSSRRKGQKIQSFWKISWKNFYPSISRQREGQKYDLFSKISRKIFIPQRVGSEKDEKSNLFENFFYIFNCWLF